MMKGLFAVMFAGSLMIPQSAVGGGSSSRDTLPLPPIPYLETIPWLTAASSARQQKPSILLHPLSFQDLALVFDQDAPKARRTFTSMQGAANAGS